MRLLGVFLLVASSAFASSVGDTYERVIAEKGQPKSVVELGSRRVLQYPDVSITIQDNLVTSVRAVITPPPPKPAPAATGAAATFVSPTGTTPEKIAALKQQLQTTANQVLRIVNQTVTARQRTSDMHVGEYPYWFHEGAMTPDFNTVDVRRSQEFPYDKYDYVTSNLTPGLVFVGHDLEFNSMTKIFYTNRSLPKKRLTESEMLEINRLYRIIGQCERQLSSLQGQ